MAEHRQIDMPFCNNFLLIAEAELQYSEVFMHTPFLTKISKYIHPNRANGLLVEVIYLDYYRMIHVYTKSIINETWFIYVYCSRIT